MALYPGDGGSLSASGGGAEGRWVTSARPRSFRCLRGESVRWRTAVCCLLCRSRPLRRRTGTRPTGLDVSQFWILAHASPTALLPKIIAICGVPCPQTLWESRSGDNYRDTGGEGRRRDPLHRTWRLTSDPRPCPRRRPHLARRGRARTYEGTCRGGGSGRV